MSGKKVILGIFIFGAIFAAALWGAKHIYAPSPGICQVCSRTIHAGQEFSLVLTDGRRIKACCPRCGLHYKMLHEGEIKEAIATDFESGVELPAHEAVYVETTAISFCAERPVERSQGGVEDLKWDRCFPSLVAFKSKSEAERFQRVNSGRLLTFDESVESVKQR